MILTSRPVADNSEHCVLDYGGSTAVPVSPRWAITADHVAASPTCQCFVPEYRQFSVLRRVSVGNGMALILLDQEVPRFYPIRRELVDAPVRCQMIGHGRTNLAQTESGYEVRDPLNTWGFPRLPLVGTNTLNPMGNWVSSVWDDNGTESEATFAENDSGGAFLVDGMVAGIAQSVSVATWGRSTFGDVSFGTQPASVIDAIDRELADADGSGAVDPSDVQYFVAAWFRSTFGRRIDQIFMFLSTYFNGRRKIK